MNSPSPEHGRPWRSEETERQRRAAGSAHAHRSKTSARNGTAAGAVRSVPAAAAANTTDWSWERVGQLMLAVLVLSVLVAVLSALLLCLFRWLHRCLKRRRRKALARKFQRSGGALFKYGSGLCSASDIAGQLSAASSFRSAERCHTVQVYEFPARNGVVPQIRISITDTGGMRSPTASGQADGGAAQRCRPYSSLSNMTIFPPWSESRTSIVSMISHVPGSPSSFVGYFSSTHNLCFEECPGAADEEERDWRFWRRFAGRYTAVQQVERQRFLGRLQQQFLPGVEPPPHAHAHCRRRHTAINNMGNVSTESHKRADKEDDCRFEPGLLEKGSTSSCFRGTLTYQLRYDFIHRVLMLHVRRANSLPIGDGPPDPYVKMYCLPERRHHWKTSIFKKSVDPEFNEMFSFDVPYSELPHRMLQEKNDYGDLLLYLAYSADLCKLYLTVAKAYNLRPMDITGASDPYVKAEQIYQRKRVKMRKTSIKRANLNPVYHECLEFDLPISQIKETNILVQVMDWDRIGRDDLLGCCVLGNESPTQEGRTQWLQCFASVYGNNLPNSQSTDKLSNGCGSLKINIVDEEDNNILTDHTHPPAFLNNNGAQKENGDLGYTEHNGSLSHKMSGDRRDMNAKYSVASLNSNGNPIGMQCFDAALRPVGTWHSILGEVPDNFRNIPKAKRK